MKNESHKIIYQKWTFSDETKTFTGPRNLGSDVSRRLIIFPHAGGTPSFYRNWANLIPQDCELWVALTPGKESRFSEPAPSSIIDIARLSISAYSRLTEVDKLIVYGHSMGAVIGYEFSRILNKLCPNKPNLLAVSGRWGLETRKDDLESKLNMSNADFLKSLAIDYDEIPNEVLHNTDYCDLYSELIKRDLRLLMEYSPEALDRINCNIINFYGTEDAIKDSKKDYWSNLTKKKFIEKEYDGGHFFIKKHVRNLIDDIFKTL